MPYATWFADAAVAAAPAAASRGRAILLSALFYRSSWGRRGHGIKSDELEI